MLINLTILLVSLLGISIIGTAIISYYWFFVRQKTEALHEQNLTCWLSENSFLESESHLKAIVESAYEAIVSIDGNGEIIFWNTAATKIFGYSEADILQKSFNILFPESSRRGYLNCIGNLKRSKKHESIGESVIIEGLHRDGYSFPIEMSISSWHKENSLFYTAIMRDITERKQVEAQIAQQADALKEKAQELEQMNARLTCINQELDQFAYIASHDLKAPLRGIASLASWIEEDAAEALPQESKQHLNLLRQRVKHMSNLIDGILHYSRAGRIDTEISTFDLKKLLCDTIDSLHFPKSFEISLPEVIPTISAPHVPMSQVFANLISNSIKYHDKENGHISITLKEKEDFYQFSIADNGPGTPAQYQEKIFTIFQTLPRDSKNKNSTGIGLTIVKKIIEWQRGKIWLEPNEWKGTTAHFTWPKQPLMEQQGQYHE